MPPWGLLSDSRAIGTTGAHRNFSLTRRSCLWRRPVVPVRKTARPGAKSTPGGSTVEPDMVGPTWLVRIGSALAIDNQPTRPRKVVAQAAAGRPVALPAVPAGRAAATPSRNRPADELTMNRTYFPFPPRRPVPYDQAPIPMNRTYFAESRRHAPVPMNRTYFAEPTSAHPADPASEPRPALAKSPYRRTGHTKTPAHHHIMHSYTSAS